MSAAVSEALVVALRGVAAGVALALVALAVKVMDDLLDEPEGSVDGRGLEDRSGHFRAVWSTPYVALGLALACGLAPGVAVSIFLSCYALGMAPSPIDRLPSGVVAWLESLACVLLGVLLTGPSEMLGSLLVVAAAQVIDDWHDLEQDRKSGLPAGKANIAQTVGRTPALALGLALWTAALFVSAPKALGSLGVLGLLVLQPGPGRPARPVAWRWGVVAGARSRGAALVGVAALAGAAGALLARCVPVFGLLPSVGWPGQGGDSGPGWLAFGLGAALSLVAAGGLVWAYRKGRAAGHRQALAGREAARRLSRRADKLDGVGRPGDGHT